MRSKSFWRLSKKIAFSACWGKMKISCCYIKMCVVGAVSLLMVSCTVSKTTVRQSPDSVDQEIVVAQTNCRFPGDRVNTPLFPITARLYESDGPHNRGGYLFWGFYVAYIPTLIDVALAPVDMVRFYFGRKCDINESTREKELFPIVKSVDQAIIASGSRLSVFGKNLNRNPIGLFGAIKIVPERIAADKLVFVVPQTSDRIVDFSVKTDKGTSKSTSVTVVPSKPPLLTVVGQDFKSSTGDSVLYAGKLGQIVFNVSNAKGAGKAFGLKLVPAINDSQKPDLEYPGSVDIGDLGAGESRQVAVPLNAGLGLSTGELTFNMKVTESNDFAPDPFEIKIRTKKLEPPDMQLAKLEVDDNFYPDRAEKFSVGNGNSIVEPGESVEVSATLLNKGTGITKDTKVKVVSDSPDITFLSPTEFLAGDIQPGNWQDLKVAFSVRKGYRGADDLPIKLVLSDDRVRFNKELPLSIKLKRSYPKTELVDIQGRETPQKIVVMPSFGDELLNIPAAKADNPDAVAVVIGVQNYKNKDVPSVEYALNDAQLFKDYLQQALGYREGNIIYLENATKADLEKVFGTSEHHAGQLFDYVKKDKSDVFVYYTGHGVPDSETKQPYLVPADADPNYIQLGGYPLNVLYDNLSRLPARRISVVLDACFSGQSDKGMIIRKASPLMIAPVLPGSGNIDLFSSSKGDEISSWYPEKRHSLFTYFFLKGLQGDADKNKDGSITTAELDEYIAENVPYVARRLYGRKQTPAFTGQESNVVARY